MTPALAVSAEETTDLMGTREKICSHNLSLKCYQGQSEQTVLLLYLFCAEGTLVCDIAQNRIIA